MVCEGCSVSKVHLIHTYLCNDVALKIYEEHAVVLLKRTCSKCGRELTLGADKASFSCYKKFCLDPKIQEVRFDFYHLNYTLWYMAG